MGESLEVGQVDFEGPLMFVNHTSRRKEVVSM